jgi:hypothetical protein
MSEKLYCEECGAYLGGTTTHIFDERVMCADCFHRLTTVCDCCSDRIWCSDAEGNDHITLCHYCYDNQFTTCESCGLLIRTDEAHYDDSDYPYCDACYREYKDRPIKEYGYKPSPIFYGEGNFFMGIELEIDEGGEIESHAERIQDIANAEYSHLYCKHDGSLNDGFEIVSHPMTLDYHLHKMCWNDILHTAVELGYSSHNSGSCGLHIHCNRSAFGVEYDDQELVIGRIVYFTEKHWDELVKFSRRTPRTLNRWAARYATISSTTKETYEKAKNRYLGRYVAVNLENEQTIEFRMFRGTLRYRTFVATLQLVHEICMLAIKLTDQDLESMSWSDFVSRIDREEKKELIEYLKTKRLYVNELAEEREEM